MAGFHQSTAATADMAARENSSQIVLYNSRMKMPWIAEQRWKNLSFLHWRVEPDIMRKHIPQSLELETFDGSAWIGLVPFEMTMRPRGAPFPVSRFEECNVRTYVRHKEKSGVYFFSLDANSPIAVVGARTFYHLPYFHAKMRMAESQGWILYDTKRTDGRGHPAEFRGNYRPTGEEFEAQPGTLEYFLTERLCLLLEHDGKPYSVDIDHRKWPLRTA
jgi:uncharacterized protein